MEKRLGLCFVLFSICILSVSLFLPIGHSTQPPINISTFYEGQIGWGPVDADPTFAYDAMSEQLLYNTYQTLIAFHGEQYWNFDPVLATNVPIRQNITMTVASTSNVSSDPVGSTWTDGSSNYTITGWTDEELDGFNSGDVVRMTDGTTWHTWTADVVSGTSLNMTMQLWRGAYVFNIRIIPAINFYDCNGSFYDTFDLKDAVYCLQRLMVMDKPGYPPWMFDKPLFDLPDHTNWNNATVMELAHLINDAIVGDYGTYTLTINVGCRFPDNEFKQNLANTWGSIYSSKYYIDKGNWDGNLFNTTKYGGPMPDWWIDFDRQGLGLRGSTLHQGTSDAGLDVTAPTSYCGSGPYHIQTVDPVNNKVILQRNTGFWMGWPAPGNTPVPPATGYLDTVEIDYIWGWTTRKADFLNGYLDTCAIPQSNMNELLNSPTGQPSSPQIKMIKNLAPLTLSMALFTFVVVNYSGYIGTGSFPNGIPLDFFNNTHTRRAFAYSFNYSTFGQQLGYGDLTYRKNWLIPGLYPDYYNSSIPSYFESLTNAEAELKAAIFNGASVWDSGFTFDLPRYTGNVFIQTAEQMISNFFYTLSTFDGRTGPAFNVNVNYAIWVEPSYYTTAELPMFFMSWSADFADAEDFCRPFVHSDGAFAYYQAYTADNGWGTLKDTLVNQAAVTPDGPARQALYQQLQQIFYGDCPGFPVPTLLNRFWCQYWVKGWYYNALAPSPYYYSMWKQDTPWYDVTGPTMGVSDGKVGMRDIAYLVAHFNAKAPVAGFPLDPKWIGVYGANGCVDPYGDRKCDMKDIAGAVQNFNAQGPGHP
jgi:ABC-type oligopeptide transport system substrate-binding subunit